MRRRFPHVPVAALLLAALASGCGRSPVVRYHTLQPLDPGSSSLSCRDVAAGVGPASVARYLDRPGIVRRSGDTRVEYDRLHRWAQSLESEILRVVGRNLSTLLESERIVVYPADAPFPLAWQVTLDVEQLDALPGGELVLRGRWILRRLPGSEPAAVEGFEIRRAGAPSGADELVEAYSDALGELSVAIARTICELAGEPAGADSGEEDPVRADSSSPAG